MFNNKRIKKLEKELEELREDVRIINCELGNRSSSMFTYYIGKGPMRMSEQFKKIIEHLGIKFVWKKEKDGCWEIKKKKSEKTK